MKKVVPWPTWLCRDMTPPWAFTASLQKVSPRPVLVRGARPSLAWANFSKMRSWYSGGMPWPLSWTAMRAPSP